MENAAPIATPPPEAGGSQDLDDFAVPSAPPPQGEVQVRLESQGEIVTSIFQSKTTQAASEKNAIKTIQYGDLDVHHRGVRNLQEVIWTTEKKLLTQTYIPALPIEKGLDYILGGTNGTFCFALQGARPSVKTYIDALQELEEHSLKQELGHRYVHMETKGDAQEMLVLLNMLLKREPQYTTFLTEIKQAVEKRLGSTPVPPPAPPGEGQNPPPKEESVVAPPAPPGEQRGDETVIPDDAAASPISPPVEAKSDLPDGKETYNHKVHITDRQFPVIKVFSHTLLPYNAERRAATEASESFELWACNVKSKKPAWQKSKLGAFKVAPGTVPCLAFNETHLAVLHQPFDEPNERTLTVSLYGLGDKVGKKVQDTFHFEFPAEHFVEQGLMRIYLNDEGVLSVSFANGAVVIDTQRKLETRIVSCTKRLVTCTCAHGRDTLLLGTEAGECFAVNWQTGDILFSEMTPIVEPIYSLGYSNRRVFMHAACSISGRMNPYFNDAMTHLPTGRLTGFDTCGTLLFAMEKYGSIQVFSTVARQIMFPFTPPKEYEWASKTFCVALGDKAKGIDPKFHTIPIRPPAYYPSVKAEADRIVALYPNGLIRMFHISQQGADWIHLQLLKQSDPKKAEALEKKMAEAKKKKEKKTPNGKSKEIKK